MVKSTMRHCQRLCFCRQGKIVIVNFRNWTPVDVWENANAVETRGVDECWHSSFQFSQTFRHECFISQWKLGKEAYAFFHEMNFGNIFPFHSVLIVVFQRILMIVLSWLASIINYFCLDFVGVTTVKYQLSYCSQGCCSY